MFFRQRKIKLRYPTKRQQNKVNS